MKYKSIATIKVQGLNKGGENCFIMLDGIHQKCYTLSRFLKQKETPFLSLEIFMVHIISKTIKKTVIL